MLTWRTVTHSQDSRFMVTGTELSRTIVPGTLSRFQICEHRSYDIDRMPDRRYAIRDAATVSDEQVREGVRPRIVQWFPDELAALEWCAKAVGSTVEGLAA
jgi:hypothetical protein